MVEDDNIPPYTSSRVNDNYGQILHEVNGSSKPGNETPYSTHSADSCVSLHEVDASMELRTSEY